MFAQKYDNFLLPIVMDIWMVLCLEITLITKIILITMALTVHGLRALDIFTSFFFFFQKNPSNWQTIGKQMKKLTAAR